MPLLFSFIIFLFGWAVFMPVLRQLSQGFNGMQPALPQALRGRRLVE